MIKAYKNKEPLFTKHKVEKEIINIFAIKPSRVVGELKNEIKNHFPEELAIWQKDPKELTIKRDDGTKFQPIKELFYQAENFLKTLFIM